MARAAREVWAKRVERWADSGLTAKQFAAETGINERTLAYWKWRLRPGAGRVEPRRPRGQVPAFLELVGTPAASGEPSATAAVSQPTAGMVGAEVSEPLEVVLGCGHRIRVPAHFDAADLRRVVDVLEAH